MKILKWLAITIVCALIAIQFIRPVRSNPTAPESQSLNAHVHVTPQVAAILDRSCTDCHSNRTRWPWYSNVAPVSWFVIDHVNHGRSHLNFSEWSRYQKREAEELLEQMCREAEAGFMPMTSYTRIHRKALLSADDIKVLCEWTDGERRKVAVDK